MPWEEYTDILVFVCSHRCIESFPIFFTKKSPSLVPFEVDQLIYTKLFFHFEDFKSCVCIELWKIIFSFKFLKIKKVELHFTRWAVIKVSIEKKSYKF